MDEPRGNPDHGSQSPSEHSLIQTRLLNLQNAARLFEEAIRECCDIPGVTMEPLLRSLSEDLRTLSAILAAKDSELSVPDLVAKFGWHVGKGFYVRAVVRSLAPCTFAILPGQDIPDGVLIVTKKCRMIVREGEHVALDLMLQRKSSGGVGWHIRSVDRD